MVGANDVKKEEKLIKILKPSAQEQEGLSGMAHARSGSRYWEVQKPAMASERGC